MYIKRVVNGEERLIKISKEEGQQILKGYLGETEQHIVFVKDKNNDGKDKRAWED